MLESLFAMFVICLVLFGLLQVFYFTIGQFFIDYAAIRGARSRAVGFQDYLVNREIRVNAIPGSGNIVEPAIAASNMSDRLTSERSFINAFVGGNRWLEYEFWFGKSANPDLQIPTTLHYSASDSMGLTTLNTEFRDYVFPETYLKHLFFPEGINLRGNAVLNDYSADYLESNNAGGTP